jgi:hypothetical protein
MIHVIGPRDARVKNAINTTSTSKNWSKGLSPFFLGPVKLYGGYISQNVENGWQYSKCYSCHIGQDEWPTEEFFKWRRKGWYNSVAVRYPMGKFAKPEYSYWDGKKLSYTEARRQIYIPVYSEAVRKTEAFKILLDMAKKQDIWLWDFDGWDYRKEGIELEQVPDYNDRKMGHAFVLAAMLEGKWGFEKLI